MLIINIIIDNVPSFLGWCYIHAHNHNDKKGWQLWWIFFGYEIWVSGSILWIIVLVLLFCAMFYAKKVQVKLIIWWVVSMV